MYTFFGWSVGIRPVYHSTRHLILLHSQVMYVCMYVRHAFNCTWAMYVLQSPFLNAHAYKMATMLGIRSPLALYTPRFSEGN